MGLFVLPMQRAIDANANILAGAKLYFYESGGLTPADVYTTSALSVAHSNPVVADAGGLFAPIYLDPATSYRAILKTSADATIQDIDPVALDLGGSDGSSQVGFINAGAGATARTVQDKLRDTFVSPMDFGAVGDGVTDDRAALLAALQSGRPVDGGGKTFAISSEVSPSSFKGLQNAKLKWSTTAAMETQQALLELLGPMTDWFIDNCDFDMGTEEDTGSDDDSSRAGLKVTSATPNTIFHERISITRCTFRGYGNGTRLQVRSVKRGLIHGNIVVSAQAAASPDPSNDCMNGIDVSQAEEVTVSDNRVYNMYTRLSGVLEKRYSRGFLFSELRNSTVSDNVVSNVDQGFDFSGSIGTETPNGNVGISVTGNMADEVETWGFKFANVVRDCSIVGNTARRFGYGGFTFSPASTALADVTKNTQRLLVVGNYALDPTGDFSSDCVGFWIAETVASPGYPRGIKLVGNVVNDSSGGGFLDYAFRHDVTYSGTHTNINEMIDCRSSGFVTAESLGFARHYVMLTGTTTQSTATGSAVAIEWATETEDTTALHSTSSSTENVTVKVTGKYRIRGKITFASNATGYRKAILYVNGNPVATNVVAAVNGDVTTVTVDEVITLTATNVVRIGAEQNSGGALNVDRTQSFLELELVKAS